MDRIPSAVLETPVLRLHQAIYRASRGWIGKRLIGRPTLLLTTRGRRTGRQRTNALIFYKDATSWAVVASNGGSDDSPGWLANLRTDPQVVVQVGTKKWPATARVASPEERARLWPLVNRHNRGLAPLLHPGTHGRYDAYQRGTSREIPVVILDATDETGASTSAKSSRRAHRSHGR